ncbi:MAG: MATE family efflux transporter [Clostridia bacterium]|nr:MATE family efflux transporter [Clostridia bacterium]
MSENESVSEEVNNGAGSQNPLGVKPLRWLIPHYALPATIALVVNALYNIVDQIFIGQSVGYLGNAATNVINPLVVIMLAVATMWGDGCASYISIQQGEDNNENASRGMCNTFVSAVIMGLLVLTVSEIFLEPLCWLFGASENSLPYAKEYGSIIAIGFPITALLISVTSCERVDGAAVYTMIGLLVACAINVVLDAVFCLVLDWGVRGAAIATVIGQLINLVWVLSYLPKLKHMSVKKKYFKPKWSVIRRVAALGLASFILQLSFALISAVANNLLASFGAKSRYGEDITVASFGITIKIYQVALNVVQGIATGSQPIMGYNYGAGKYKRTKSAFWISVIVGTAFLALATIVFQTAPMALVSLFGEESDLYNEFAVMCLRIFLMLCICNGLQTCTSIFFQSVGKSVHASINTFLKQIILVPVCMVIMAYAMGVTGVLWTGPITDFLAVVISVILLKLEWKKLFPKKPEDGPQDKQPVQAADDGQTADRQATDAGQLQTKDAGQLEECSALSGTSGQESAHNTPLDG